MNDGLFRPMNDIELETTYLGDSVYISLDEETVGFVIFLNNGERAAASDRLYRKDAIYLETPAALNLVRYLTAHGVSLKP